MVIKKYRIIEDSLLRRFKNQNALVKQFGKKALIMYNMLTSDYVPESQIIKEGEESGLLNDEVKSILNFMINEGMVDIIESEEEPVKEQKKKPRRLAEGYKPKIREGPSINEPKPSQPLESEEEQLSPSQLPEEEPLEQPNEQLANEEPKESAEEQLIEEPTIEEPTIDEPQEPGEQQSSINEPEPSQPSESEEEQLSPSQLPEEEPLEQLSLEEQSQTELPPPEPQEGQLSPSESVIFERYGKKGVEVFRLVDGKRTINDIAQEADVNANYVLDVLKYAQDQGLISLGEGTKEETEEKAKFSPLTSELKEEVLKEEDTIKSIEFIKKDVLRLMSVKLNLILRYGKAGRKLFELLENKKRTNEVEIVRNIEIPLKEVDEIINTLKSEGLVKVRPMQRDEVNSIFGYDSYIIYKRYGKKGVIFYELIGKEKDIKDIARLIGEKDPDKVIEIFEMVHKVLGVPLPIEKELLKKHLMS